LATVLAALLLAGGAWAAVPQNEGIEAPLCHGRQATIVGTGDDDVLHGTPERDVIWGGDGDDTINGSLGNDLICGGPGADVIHGGRGNDEVDGGAGDGDRAIGDLGDDRVLGGPGSDDEVSGGLGIDIVNGGPGSSDLVHGDYGWDRMSGGAGGGDIASFATKVAGGSGSGVWASLAARRALGDGHDRLFGFESLEGSAFRDTLVGSRRADTILGGPGDDKISGGGGADTIDGGRGSDSCGGAKGRTSSCGKEPAPRGSAYVQLDPVPAGATADAEGGAVPYAGIPGEKNSPTPVVAGGGLEVVGGAGPDRFAISFDTATQTFGIVAGQPLAAGPGCARAPDDPKRVYCPTGGGGPRWLMADGGPGDDNIRVAGSLGPVGFVRLAGGRGDDVLRGGPEDDLVESGPGADRLFGGAGADGLVGGIPGPTFLYGGEDGDLLAAGGGCAGGSLVGGPGRDDASFAEVGSHPGVLQVSFPAHAAWIPEVTGCLPVHLSQTDEDMEGSFGPDVLVGNSQANAMLGQPGADRFYGNGGDDVIDARDGMRDQWIQCGPGDPPRPKPRLKGKPLEETKPTGHAAGRALTDAGDPEPFNCTIVKHGTPVPGLNG
jgi:Ca2+-binding RTX toxin-like protein